MRKVELAKFPSRRLVIIILLCFTAFAVPLRSAYGSEELIQNGGFETGDLRGWTYTNAYVLLSYDTMGANDAMSHPPHTGAYSAAIGTATSEGMISQTVTIPAESSTAFSAWYRLEPGSSLTFYLKASDGSMIQQWSFSGSSSAPVWTELTYTLDATYAGKQVTVEIDGIGYESIGDYFAFVDDISMVASIVEYVAQISVTGLPQLLSASVYVDGQPLSERIQVGQNISLAFLPGSAHTISVDQYLAKDNLTRYYCAQPSATVNTDESVAFDYQPQFYLAISSPLGSVSGEGWYNQSSQASISVAQSSVPIPGLLGLLGARYVFQKWTGDVSSASLPSQVSMDGPKSVSAVWVIDYTFLYVTLGAIIGCFLFAAWMFIRKREKTGKGGTAIFLEDRKWGEQKTELHTEDEQRTKLYKEKLEPKKQKKPKTQ
jgi:hypothetical protein